eukprot:3108625-Rhodomonas_salina.4
MDSPRQDLVVERTVLVPLPGEHGRARLLTAELVRVPNQLCRRSPTSVCALFSSLTTSVIGRSTEAHAGRACSAAQHNVPFSASQHDQARSKPPTAGERSSPNIVWEN